MPPAVALGMHGLARGLTDLPPLPPRITKYWPCSSRRTFVFGPATPAIQSALGLALSPDTYDRKQIPPSDHGFYEKLNRLLGRAPNRVHQVVKHHLPDVLRGYDRDVAGCLPASSARGRGHTKQVHRILQAI
jgi:hypothetical protein